MADIVARYVGNKRVEAENPRSGGRLTFDQGKPDGLGESYDPVEGLLGAFAGCTLTMIAYAAEANGADAKGATAECDCTMAERLTALPPSRSRSACRRLNTRIARRR